ncbi:MAG: winged helix-turn-helix domain-containing protein [Fermentimonas sp.]|jgi:hypothetical protein
MDKRSIGTNAGIIWNLLSNNQRWSIDELAKEARLDEEEIYTAIGWLARENKIEMEQGADGKDEFYLVIEYYF